MAILVVKDSYDKEQRRPSSRICVDYGAMRVIIDPQQAFVCYPEGSREVGILCSRESSHVAIFCDPWNKIPVPHRHILARAQEYFYDPEFYAGGEQCPFARGIPRAIELLCNWQLSHMFGLVGKKTGYTFARAHLGPPSPDILARAEPCAMCASLCADANAPRESARVLVQAQADAQADAPAPFCALHCARDRITPQCSIYAEDTRALESHCARFLIEHIRKGLRELVLTYPTGFQSVFLIGEHFYASAISVAREEYDRYLAPRKRLRFVSRVIDDLHPLAESRVYDAERVQKKHARAMRELLRDVDE